MKTGTAHNEATLVSSASGTTVTSGVWTPAATTTSLAEVTSVDIKFARSLKTDRYYAGVSTKAEPLENGWIGITGELDVDYAGDSLYNTYYTDGGLALQVSFTGPLIASTYHYQLNFMFPVIKFEDGASPQVAGPDIVSQKLAFTALDDGTNGSIQVVYQSTDVAP